MKSREVIEAAAERSRVTWHDRVARLRRLAPTLLLGAIAAGASWLIAKELFGQTGAFFAPVAAIITLGLTVGSRLERAIELSLGVPLGIALADVLVLEVGSGVPQLVGIVFLATSTAVFLGGGPLLVTQAAVSAILVVTLQPPTDGLSFTRAADALIGCGVALLLNFVIAPIDPVALVRREAAPLLRELAAVLDAIARALNERDRDAALAALRRARDIDASTQRFLEALTIGRETAAAAPVRRGQRGPLAVYSEAGGQIDLAVRNVRVLARGVVRAIETGDRVPPAVGDSLLELRQAVVSLAPWLEDPRRADAVIEPAVQAARHASSVLEQTTNLSVSVIVGQVRSTAVDLLRTTGMEPAEARDADPRAARGARALALQRAGQDDAVLAQELGGQQALVGGLEERRDRGRVLRRDRHAGRGGDRAGDRPGGVAHRAHEALGGAGGLGLVGVGEDHGELLAAGAADDVARPHVAFEDVAEGDQDLVADRVAVDVVDALEVVDVEQDEADRGVVARGARQLGGEALVEVAAVEEAGQLVGAGLDGEQLAPARVVVGEGRERGEALDQLRLLG